MTEREIRSLNSSPSILLQVLRRRRSCTSLLPLPHGQRTDRTALLNSETLEPEESTTTTTPPTLTTDEQRGPVGQPAPTITGQVTSYRYTTTDADGNTVVLSDIFTPSFPPTQPPPPPTLTGSILDFNEWLSVIGTNTVPVLASGAEPWRVPAGAYKIAAGMVTGIIGGAMLVL